MQLYVIIYIITFELLLFNYSGDFNVNEQELSKYDQKLTDYLRIMPITLFSFFSALKEQGFNEDHSLLLTIELLKSLKQ